MTARSTAICWGVCAGLGCHEDLPPPAPTPGPPHEGMNVLDPGKGPLGSLRYHLVKGARTPIELVTDISYGPDTPKLPVLVVDLDVIVDAVDPDGTAHVRSVVTHGTARGDKPELMASQAALLEGVAVVLAVGPDGQITSSKVEARPDLPKAMLASLSALQDSIAALSLPLPTVPVGVGATWKTRKTVHPNGITMTADTTYTLTAIDGDKLTLSRKAVFSGSTQTIEHDGVKLDIKTASGTLEGTGVADLGRMVMRDQATSHTKLEMIVSGGSAGSGSADEQGDGPQQVEVTLVTTATPDPAPAPAAPAAVPADAGVVDAAAPPADAKPAPKKRKPKKPPPDAAESTDVPTEDQVP